MTSWQRSRFRTRLRLVGVALGRSFKSRQCPTNNHENALLAMFALGLAGSVMRYANGPVSTAAGIHG